MPSMIEAWLSRSENTAVRSSQSASSSAAFAFQQETNVSAASVPRNAARSPSKSTWGSNLPQMKRTDAVPAPYLTSAWAPARTTAGWLASPR